MKTLIIARHAKSGWDNPDLRDFDRTLNQRGLRDAPFMADKIKGLVSCPDLIVTSGAVRARTTAGYFVEAFDYPAEKLVIDDRIYDGGPRYIINLLKKSDDSVNFVALFGHNPDITSVVTFFSGKHFENVPTCGVVCIEFDIESWSDIDKENGNMKFFEYPKKYFNRDMF